MAGWNGYVRVVGLGRMLDQQVLQAIKDLAQTAHLRRYREVQVPRQSMALDGPAGVIDIGNSIVIGLRASPAVQILEAAHLFHRPVLHEGRCPEHLDRGIGHIVSEFVAHFGMGSNLIKSKTFCVVSCRNSYELNETFELTATTY